MRIPGFLLAMIIASHATCAMAAEIVYASRAGAHLDSKMSATKNMAQGVRGRRRRIGRPTSEHESVGRDALLEKTCELLQTLPPDKACAVGRLITIVMALRHVRGPPPYLCLRDRSRQ